MKPLKLVRTFIPVTLNGRGYRAEIDSDGAVSVFREDGPWLGWVNAKGEPQSTGGLDLRAIVAAVAIQARI